MNKFKVFFFGTTNNGFEIYPEADDAGVYYNYQFEENSEWKLSVLQTKDKVRYTYTRYDIWTSNKADRKKTCFGISIVLSKKYIKNVRTYLLFFFEECLEQIIEDSILLEKKEDLFCFRPSSLKLVNSYLKIWIDTFNKTLDTDFKSSMLPLRTRINEQAPTQIIRLSLSATDIDINKAFAGIGGVDMLGDSKIGNNTHRNKALNLKKNKNKDETAKGIKHRKVYIFVFLFFLIILMTAIISFNFRSTQSKQKTSNSKTHPISKIMLDSVKKKSDTHPKEKREIDEKALNSILKDLEQKK